MIKTSPGYEANRARISLVLPEFTVPLVSRIDNAFDGDMVGALVLGAIAHRNVVYYLGGSQLRGRTHRPPGVPPDDARGLARLLQVDLTGV